MALESNLVHESEAKELRENCMLYFYYPKGQR